MTRVIICVIMTTSETMAIVNKVVILENRVVILKIYLSALFKPKILSLYNYVSGNSILANLKALVR